MSGIISNGVHKILINGSQLGFTEEDTVSKITEDNSSEVSLNVEEKDQPIYKKRNESKLTGFEFKIANPSKEAYKTLFGVEESTVGDELILDFTNGETNVIENATFELTPKMGWGFRATGATIRSQISESVGKNHFMGIIVTVMFDNGFKMFIADEGEQE